MKGSVHPRGEIDERGPRGRRVSVPAEPFPDVEHEDEDETEPLIARPHPRVVPVRLVHRTTPLCRVDRGAPGGMRTTVRANRWIAEGAPVH